MRPSRSQPVASPRIIGALDPPGPEPTWREITAGRYRFALAARPRPDGRWVARIISAAGLWLSTNAPTVRMALDALEGELRELFGVGRDDALW